ncbi:hypothetical protein CH252_18735 [Rhodococcus sp. 06-1477-1B]|nr:hypothetical protein CH252_18735 [Rhodococcus sp. 06-1477-1B]
MPSVNITKSAGYGRRGPEDAGGGTVFAPEWAVLSGSAGGNPYGVVGDAWKITPGAADRELVISAGTGFGWGVLDTTTAEARIQLPAPSSGTVRHLIVVHRDWQARQSSFKNIPGSSGYTLPSRETAVGLADDQPIALVAVTAGQAQIGEVTDLRVWPGAGGVYGANGQVLQYLDTPGTVILLPDDSRAERVIDGLGNQVWRYSDTSRKFSRVSELGAGFQHYVDSGWSGLNQSRDGNIVTAGGALIKDPGGVGSKVPAGTPIARLSTGYRPSEKVATTNPRVELTAEGRFVLTTEAVVRDTLAFSVTFFQNNTGA